MKRIFQLFFTLTLIVICQFASAQATMPRKGETGKVMRDGVARKFGKMVEIKNGKEIPLSRTFTAAGTKVSSSGMVTYADGTKEKLPEGFAINKEGKKVIFEDDMIAPAKIRENQKKVTGKEETTIIMKEKTHVIVNDSTQRKLILDTVRTVETR
jgi:hypothetical protein